MSRWLSGVLVCTWLAFASSAALAAGDDNDIIETQGVKSESAEPDAAELKADVPALHDLHDVVRPLWHDAWPNKDYQLMKDLLPDAKEGVAAVQKADLPGILRDKQEKWDTGVKHLVATLDTYEKAAADDDEQGMLDAVEEFHSAFEHLYRLTRPVMKELDAYHVVLYRIYHYYMPRQQLDELRGASKELASACATLAEAKVPTWCADKADDLAPAIELLCTRTDELVATAKGEDWKAINQSVETMHTQYQAVEGLFD